MTGDIVINPHAKVLIMTTEIYRNMVVSNDEEVKDVAYVIFDEVHYINDIERGYVWEESIIYSPKQVRFLCLSATIPNAEQFSDWISAIKEHKVTTVVATKRHVPLNHQFFDYELGLTTLEKIKNAKEIPSYDNVFRRGDRGSRRSGRGGRDQKRAPLPSHITLVNQLKADKLPCLFFSFSRKDCQQKAKELARKNMFKPNKEITQFVANRLNDAPADINKLQTTRLLRETLSQGIGFHHAGLLPVLKGIVEDLFSQGKINVLYTTETFAVGINMPAKTVCFNSLRKYDGISFRPLNTKEYFQIAGRAGRRGIDTVGYAISMIYRPTFNYSKVKKLTSKDIEPIKSQFRLSVNTVLNLIDQKTPDEIEHILRLSFFSYQKFGVDYATVPSKKLLARYNSIVRKLTKHGYVQKEEEGSLKITTKGQFSSHIFADEITMGELFATNFVNTLSDYQILLALAALVYEPREGHKIKQKFKEAELKDLKRKLRNNEYLSREKHFENLDVVTVFVHPIYNGKTFFDILDYTNLLEGDVIRVLAQIMDRCGQIRKAAVDSKLLHKIQNCEGIIKHALDGIYIV